MIIYEVSLHINAEIEETYISWLYDKHIPDILAIDGFLGANVEEVTDPISEKLHLIVRYEVRSELDLFNYLELNAPLLRQEPKDLFGEAFTATRKISRLIQRFSNPDAEAHPHQDQ